jgi:hypothetical protein
MVSLAKIQEAAARFPAYTDLQDGKDAENWVRRILRHAAVPGFKPPEMEGGGKDPFEVRFWKFCLSLPRFTGIRPACLSQSHKQLSAGTSTVVAFFFGVREVPRSKREGVGPYPAGTNAARLAAMFLRIAAEKGFTIIAGRRPSKPLPKEGESGEGCESQTLQLIDPMTRTDEDVRDLLVDFCLHVWKRIIPAFRRELGSFEAFAFGETTMSRFLSTQWKPRSWRPRTGNGARQETGGAPDGDHALSMAACFAEDLRQAIYFACASCAEGDPGSTAENDGGGDPSECAAAVWQICLTRFWGGLLTNLNQAIAAKLRRPADATFRQWLGRQRNAHEFLWRLLDASLSAQRLLRALRVLGILAGRNPALARTLKLLLLECGGVINFEVSPLIRFPVTEKAPEMVAHWTAAELLKLRSDFPADPKKLWDAPLPRQLFGEIQATLAETVQQLPLLRTLLLYPLAIARLETMAALLPGGDDRATMDFFFSADAVTKTEPKAHGKIAAFAVRLNALCVTSPLLDGGRAHGRWENLCQLLRGTKDQRIEIQKRTRRLMSSELHEPSPQLREDFAMIVTRMAQCQEQRGRDALARKIESNLRPADPPTAARLEGLLDLTDDDAKRVSIANSEREPLREALANLLPH